MVLQGHQTSRLLTVGLPVFNGMPYLPEALESLLSQSYRDFTVLVIDDGSTDGTLNYLQTIRDPRVQVFSQLHSGLSETLNRMMEISRTPWLVRHDADDIAYPRRLEQTVEYIRRYPTAGMFYTEADYYADKKGKRRFRTTKGSPQKLREITRSGYLLAICHPSVTLNVEKARAVVGYRFNLYVEDIDLWWRMALAYDIHFIPEVTVGVRPNHTSSSSRNLEQQEVNTLYIQYLLLSYLSNFEPQSYGEAYPLLHGLLDKHKLKLKRYLRETNIQLSHRHYLKALLRFAFAFLSSPSIFFERAYYELFPRPYVSNGTDPLRLSEQCCRFVQKYHNAL